MNHSSIAPLLYALKDGCFVGIDDVPNGIRCGCTCPKCGEPLVARNNGTHLQHHFAHFANSTCTGSAETALHLLAKDVLSKTRTLMLPNYDDYNGTRITFDEIILEERQQETGLQPDCIGIKNNHRLWIEIKAHHAVEPSKLSYIQENKQGCVEINLSEFLNKSYTRDDIERFLSTEKDQKEWLYIAGYYEKHIATKQAETICEQAYIETRLKAHSEEHLLPLEQCISCPHHSTRFHISQLLRQHIPEYPTMIAEIEKLPIKALKRPLVKIGTPPKASIVCGNSYITIHNRYKEGKGRRLFYFFRTILPKEALHFGEECRYCVGKYSCGKIICNNPLLV